LLTGCSQKYAVAASGMCVGSEQQSNPALHWLLFGSQYEPTASPPSPPPEPSLGEASLGDVSPDASLALASDDAPSLPLLASLPASSPVVELPHAMIKVSKAMRFMLELYRIRGIVNDMKRRRTMLLCVTATSMVAAVGCRESQPVGTVAHPMDMRQEAEAGAEPTSDEMGKVAMVPDAGRSAEQRDASSTTAAAPRDAGIAPHVIGRTPLRPPDPARVGTTANAPDVEPPSVGTTANVPDHQPKK
jgi:hypothetical protein